MPVSNMRQNLVKLRPRVKTNRWSASIPRGSACGSIPMREGDAGDLFYVVAAGRVEVSTEGGRVGELGPGDYFGEIALLRDLAPAILRLGRRFRDIPVRSEELQ